MYRRCARLWPLLLSLGGCASVPMELGAGENVPAGEVLVFGRVKVVSDGEQIQWSTTEFGRTSWFGPGEFRIFFVDERDGKTVVFSLSGDGSLFWHLRPGAYSLAAFDWKPDQASHRNGRIASCFDVLARHTAVYIGTATILFTGWRYVVGIEDEYEPAVQSARKRFPGLDGAPGRSLMRIGGNHANSPSCGATRIRDARSLLHDVPRAQAALPGGGGQPGVP